MKSDTHSTSANVLVSFCSCKSYFEMDQGGQLDKARVDHIELDAVVEKIQAYQPHLGVTILQRAVASQSRRGHDQRN